MRTGPSVAVIEDPSGCRHENATYTLPLPTRQGMLSTRNANAVPDGVAADIHALQLPCSLRGYVESNPFGGEP